MKAAAIISYAGAVVSFCCLGQCSLISDDHHLVTFILLFCPGRNEAKNGGRK